MHDIRRWIVRDSSYLIAHLHRIGRILQIGHPVGEKVRFAFLHVGDFAIR